MSYQPLSDHVLLEVLDTVPEQYICKVLAVGPGAKGYTARIPVGVAVGDKVLVGRYAAHWVFDKKSKYLVCREGQLRLRMEEDDARTRKM